LLIAYVDWIYWIVYNLMYDVSTHEFLFLQEGAQSSVIQMVAGDLVMISVFSVLSTVSKGAV